MPEGVAAEGFQGNALDADGNERRARRRRRRGRRRPGDRPAFGEGSSSESTVSAGEAGPRTDDRESESGGAGAGVTSVSAGDSGHGAPDSPEPRPERGGDSGPVSEPPSES